MPEGVTTNAIESETKALYERVLASGENAAFFERSRTVHSFAKPDVIGIVPGAFYRDHKDTGADGARVLAIARELDCAAELIEIPSFGTLAECAVTILRWLETKRGQRVAFITLSKGGADLKTALRKQPAAFENVSAWVDFSGLVHGTPLIEWLSNRRLRWWGVHLLLWLRGHSRKALGDLAHGPGTPLDSWPQLPPQMKVVHVVGFPLRKHLAHRWATRAYERLAPLGPNDGGGILLSDCERLPGIVCPLWGADHYLTPSWDVVPLLTGIVAAALAPRHDNQCASQPVNEPATRSTT
jgi:hypothetical protein